MKWLLVTGSRDWNNEVRVRSVLQWMIREYGSELVIVHGAYRGADKIAGKVARELGLTEVPMPADWKRYGNAAGPIRNQEMLDTYPDISLGIAFHDDIDGCTGTKDMVNRLKKAKIKGWIFRSNGWSDF